MKCLINCQKYKPEENSGLGGKVEEIGLGNSSGVASGCLALMIFPLLNCRFCALILAALNCCLFSWRSVHHGFSVLLVPGFSA